jgi:beta-1,2-mannobiose phosphorylase / 1,2-beta-oligomannan phosphorylase
VVGVYRTYWSILDPDDPSVVLRTSHDPLIEANPALTDAIKDLMYIDNVVFTTGIVDAGDHYVVASGEADLACRITHIPKSAFA